jgi:hypothetical protein
MISSGYGYESTLSITSDPVPNQMFVGRSINVRVWIASGLDPDLDPDGQKLPTKIEKKF